MAEYKMTGDIVDYTTVAAVLGGDVVLIGADVIAVIISDIAAGETGSAYVKGIVSFDCSEDIAIGANAFWSASSDEITSTDTDVYAGRVTKATSGAKVEVNINYKHEVTGA